MGHRNWQPPFRLTFTIRLRSIHPQGHWKNIFFYGNNNGERGLAVWLYPHNPGHGLSSTIYPNDFIVGFCSLAGRLHIRVNNQRNGNDGCDPPTLINVGHSTKVSIHVGRTFMGRKNIKQQNSASSNS